MCVNNVSKKQEIKVIANFNTAIRLEQKALLRI